MEPIVVPGSKSLTHRAYVLAADSDEPSTITGALRSADTDATLHALLARGADAEPDGTTVRFRPGHPRRPDGPLDCHNAGTALRLLTAQAALRSDPVTLTGDASLRNRPNDALVEALRALGATIDGQGRAPFTIRGPIRPGRVTLPGGSSSQYASALMLALPRLDGPSDLELEAPVFSSPYLDLNLAIAHDFGLHIHEATATGRRFTMPGNDTPRCADYAVEADWSTAAFPLIAGALLGEAHVAGLRTDSQQGDKRILDLLHVFGARVDAPGGLVRVRQGDLSSPGTVDVQDTPDMFPALCILAAASHGTTTFTGGAALRHKESDRIRAMVEGLRRMGIQAEERPDGAIIHGGSFQAATVDSHNDHRIHMAFQIAARLAAGQADVSDPECVAVSYPGFHHDLQTIVEAS